MGEKKNYDPRLYDGSDYSAVQGIELNALRVKYNRLVGLVFRLQARLDELEENASESRWIDRHPESGVECPLCHGIFEKITEYCPDCGAHMGVF